MRSFACASVKLLAPSTGAVGFFVLGVATAGILPSVDGAGVVWAAAIIADAATSAAAKIMIFIEIPRFPGAGSHVREMKTRRATLCSDVKMEWR
jgi:hypothetical protein